MQVLSLFWGLLSIILMIIAFTPCLGALNWIVIPFAGVGVVVSGVALASSRPGDKGAATAGLAMNVIAMFAGFLRLMMGGGIL